MREFKSYLELQCQRLEDFESDRNWMEQHIDFGFSELSMRDFYSQSFKPELIEKYFEGLSVRGKLVMEFQVVNPQVFDFEKTQNLYRIIHNLNPRTLDDFITDCQRAGITLYWKEVSNDV